MKKIEYIVEGMRCQSCASAVSHKIESFTEIKEYSVNVFSGEVEIEVEDKFDEKTFIVAINSLGFDIKRKKDKSLYLKNDRYFKGYELAILVIFGILLMYVSLTNMLMEKPWVFDLINMHVNPLGFAICTFTLALPIMIIAFRFYIPGIKALFRLKPNMDSLISIASIAAFIYSIVYFVFIIVDSKNAAEYAHNIIFESGGMVIVLVYLGKYIEQNTKNKSKNAINNLIDVIPKNVKKQTEDGNFETVCVNEIKVGDIVFVNKGERIPVDGVVVEGMATIDNSAITGESKTIEIRRDIEVLAGAIVLEGSIQIKAMKISSEATLNSILGLVAKSQFSKSKTSRLIDKVSLFFVPVTLGVSIITFGVWFGITQEVSFSIKMFMNTLVIACPCAIGLATPLANVLSSLKALKNGIVFKNMDIVSKFKDIDVVIFDKTGTLTTGEFEIVLESVYDESKTQYQIFQIVGALEAKQNHPIANSFMKKIKELNVQHFVPGEVKNLESLGLSSVINGKTYFIGSKKLLRTLNIESYYIETGTTLYLVEENKVIAKFTLKDQLQNGAKELVEYLNERKIQTLMLTGDNKTSADYIAKSLGISLYRYDLLPNQKYEIVEQLKNGGKHIMFIGDGINDAPALSLSDVAVAPYNSSDIANDSSDIYLLSKDLNPVIKMFNLAKYTYSIIKMNILWAFIYNIIAVFFAAGVFMPVGVQLEPWMSALAMSLSDICVIATSLTIKGKKI